MSQTPLKQIIEDAFARMSHNYDAAHRLAADLDGNRYPASGPQPASADELPVTQEMIIAGQDNLVATAPAIYVAQIYRAMAALAPKPRTETTSEGFDRLVTLPDALRCAESARYNAEGRVRELEGRLAVRDARIAQLEADAFLAACDTDDPWRVTAEHNTGDHPYHGPTRPVHDENGTLTGRESVPDPVHEEFHRSIGHVLGGKVLPAARRQMEEAIKQAPKDKAPFPHRVIGFDPRRMGLA